jgi:lysophospholipase L1-like esterase
MLAALVAVAVAAGAAFVPARAQRPAPTQASACSAPKGQMKFAHGLSHTGRRIAEAKSLSVVAIGSSSTAGAGASSPAASYPSRLLAELKHRFPLRPIWMKNHGVNGAEVVDMLAKFNDDVEAEKPDLVLWQLGTNSLLRDRTLAEAAQFIRQGMSRFKSLKTDLILINPQYAPKVLAKPEAGQMLQVIDTVAKQADVNVFDRFAVMRHWRVTENMPYSAFLSPDELHMNDWSYACIAKLLGGAIAEAAARPAQTAGTARR